MLNWTVKLYKVKQTQTNKREEKTLLIITQMYFLTCCTTQLWNFFHVLSGENKQLEHHQRKVCTEWEYVHWQFSWKDRENTGNYIGTDVTSTKLKLNRLLSVSHHPGATATLFLAERHSHSTVQLLPDPLIRDHASSLSLYMPKWEQRRGQWLWLSLLCCLLRLWMTAGCEKSLTTESRAAHMTKRRKGAIYKVNGCIAYKSNR